MATTQKHVICRTCHAQCGLIVDLDAAGNPLGVHGDKNNPAYHGYSCIKGRESISNLRSSKRLHWSQKRQADGSHAPIEWRTAAAEVGDRVKAIVAEHGPDSVAMYLGTFGFNNFTAQSFLKAFLESIGSQMVFSSVSIDQPGKSIGRACHGSWLAGPYRHEEWDAQILLGTNPIVSMINGTGMNPAQSLHEAKKRGMKLVVIDPRVTDVAKKADLHLQCNPGEDAAILACIARQIIEEGLYDKAFVAAETEGFETLKAALAPFTPEAVALRAGVTPAELVEAARIYGAARRGDVSCGTGANMSGYANVAEYLATVIMTLMGHWRRTGELRRDVGVLMKKGPFVAAGTGSLPAFDFGKKLRIRGFTDTAAGLPTAALSDEILMPGPGQVKALFVLGGNPMLAWPDQIKAFEAMQALDLLVCFDPQVSKTAKLAHYIIAPRMTFETHGNTALQEFLGYVGGGWGYDEPYAQVSDPIFEVPAGSNLCEEHEFIHTMAGQMGVDLNVRSMAVISPAEAENYRTMFKAGEPTPGPLEAWDATLKGAPVPIAELRADPEAHAGKVMGLQAKPVEPKPEGWATRLVIGHPVMLQELAEVQQRLDTPSEIGTGDFPYRVISRRLSDIHNSCWHDNDRQRRRVPHHPAFVNPADMADLGLAEGDVVELESARAAIRCVVVAAPDVRPGCLSVPHAWGSNPDEAFDPLGDGGNTGKLSFNDRDFDRITGIPLMSAIPVRVRAIRDAALAAE